MIAPRYTRLGSASLPFGNPTYGQPAPAIIMSLQLRMSQGLAFAIPLEEAMAFELRTCTGLAFDLGVVRREV